MTIKEALSAADMSQSELSRLSGVPLRLIQYAIAGRSKIGNMSHKNISAISSVLGVAPDELSDDPGSEQPKLLKMRELLTKEAYDGLTPEERRHLLKVEQAKEYSGWRKYPDTCAALLERIPDSWWDKYSAQHIGETMALLKMAYDAGRENS